MCDLSCSRERDARPNVVWISLDTLRADHVSAYGYGRDTTPQIDRVAKQGTVFERCYSTTTWTLPAHISMLTGLPVSAHGMCEQTKRDADHPDQLPLRGKFVSELLRDSGYATAGFYTWKFLDPQFGLGAGFDIWERVDRNYNTVPGVREAWTAAKERGDWRSLKALYQKHRHLFESGRPWAAPAVDRALAWMDGELDGEGRPFLLFLHLFDIHDPYAPPKPFDRRFDPDDSLGTGESVASDGGELPDDAWSVRGLAKQVALYDGEIASVDTELSRLFEYLDRRGLTENTLLIVTADHGEEFHEHGAWTHRHDLYRETLRVPLIVRWPGHVPAGKRVSELVSLVDLAPTVLDLASVGAAQALPGVDLVATANADSPPKDRQVFAELSVVDDQRDAENRAKEAQWMLTIVGSTEKVIVHMAGTPKQSALRLDLTQDPTERGMGEPVDWSSPDGVRIAAEVEQWREELWSLRERAPRRNTEAHEIDEATKIELSALGYASATSQVFAAESSSRPLCMDGCVWRRSESEKAATQARPEPETSPVRRK